MAEGKERDRLIEQNLSLVHGIAGQLKKTLGKVIDHADLVGYGSKGLVEAANRFDPRAGAAFSTFAYYRIRGAMLDGVRAMGWYSRSDHARYLAEERTHQYLAAEADRDGAGETGTHAAESAGPEDESPRQALAGIASSLSAIATVHITSLAAADAVPDDRAPAADTVLGDVQMGRRVRAAVAELPEKERALMEMYYFQDKNLVEAGAQMGLSKSWACRLHARAVDMLRKRLAQEL